MIIMNVKLLYALATTLYSIAWGIMYTFTTRYIAVELGGGVRAIILFTALNWGFTLFGILAGKVANVLGEKKTILLSLLCSPPLLLATLLKEPFILSFVVSTTALPWVLSWSIIVKLFFSQAKNGYGKEYSEYTIGMGFGFFIGSILTGLIYALGGSTLVFIINSTLLVLPPLIYYRFYPSIFKSREENVDPCFKPVIKKMYMPFLSLILAVFTRELLYSIAPSKLNANLELVTANLDDWLKYTVYGVAYSGGALVSPLIRLLAGRIVDKYGSIKTYVATVLGYVAIYWLFTETRGLTPLLVWQIPLYPFLEISFNTLIAQKLDSKQLVSGFGATQAFTAIGGLMLTPLLVFRDMDLRVAGLIITFVNLASVIIITVKRNPPFA